MGIFSKFKVGDRIEVDGNIYTVSWVSGRVVWVEEVNESFFDFQCKKI